MVLSLVQELREEGIFMSKHVVVVYVLLHVCSVILFVLFLVMKVYKHLHIF